jgi:hypothetical protein
MYKFLVLRALQRRGSALHSSIFEWNPRPSQTNIGRVRFAYFYQTHSKLFIVFISFAMPKVKLYIAVTFISVKYLHLSEEGSMLPRLDCILDTTEEVCELDRRNDEIRKYFHTFTELL